MINLDGIQYVFGLALIGVISVFGAIMYGIYWLITHVVIV